MRTFELQKLVRENVKNLQPYSSARDEFTDLGSSMVFIDANENPFNTGVNRYPDPNQSDIKAILSKQHKIAPNQILLGNGSDEVLDLIFRAFCEPNIDNVITLPPTYGMYGVLAATNAIEDRKVLLSQTFQPRNEAILEQVDSKTKLLFLCSPNNPTGNLFQKEIIEELLAQFKGLVVIDEAYIDFARSDSWINRLNEFPNLVITQTLSKAYGMAGIRLGMCYASEEITTILKKIKPPYNVNQLTQQRALERIKATEKIAEEVKDILAARSNLINELQKISFIKNSYATDANFVLVRVDNAALRYAQLIKKGIVVRNRSSQPLCENTLRFTIGTDLENQKLITALKELKNG